MLMTLQFAEQMLGRAKATQELWHGIMATRCTAIRRGEYGKALIFVVITK